MKHIKVTERSRCGEQTLQQPFLGFGGLPIGFTSKFCDSMPACSVLPKLSIIRDIVVKYQMSLAVLHRDTHDENVAGFAVVRVVDEVGHTRHFF